jgi:hypothetical protein
MTVVAIMCVSFLFITSAPNVAASSHVWTTRTVDSADAYSTSMAIDAQDHIHIVYFGYSAGALMYATNDHPYGNWSITKVDDMGYFGAKAAMVLDKNGAVHISYYDGISKQLKYATNQEGSFVIQAVDNTTVADFLGNDIAVDAAGKAHMSYVVGNSLFYATNAGGSWNITEINVGGKALYPTNIAIGSDNVVHIIYRSYIYDSATTTVGYSVGHLWKQGADWSQEIIVSFNAVATGNLYHLPGALTQDSLNRLHFVLGLPNPIYPYGASIAYYMRNTSTWSVGLSIFQTSGDVLDSVMSIIPDALNEAHVSFSNDSSVYYTSSASGWALEEITGLLSRVPSLAMDSMAKLYICFSYRDLNSAEYQWYLRYVTTAILPSEPWNVHVAALADRKLAVDWSAPNSSGDHPRLGYEVYLYNSEPLSSGAMPIMKVALPPTDGSLTFTDLYPGGQYWISLRATSSAGYSDMSSIVMGTPGDRPSAPYLMANGALGGVRLTWNPPTYSNGSLVTNYSISWGTSLAGMTNEIVLGDLTTYDHLGLSPGTYYYKVNAKNGIGWGPYSSIVSMVVQAQIPSAPLGITAVAGDGKVTLTWSPPASDGGSSVTRYDIYRGTTAEGIATISFAHVTGTTLTYVDNSVTNGQKYYYLVIATNAQGAGSPSEIVSATPQGTTPPPNEGTTSGDMTTIIVIVVVVLIAAIGAGYFLMRGRGRAPKP